MSLAILSTLISSIALVGVTIGLYLQARQLRVNNIQVAHISRIELIKAGLDYPDFAARVEGYVDPEELVKAVLLNWQFTHLMMTYDIRDSSRANIESTAERFFAVEDARKWWVDARDSYRENAISRRQKKFFSLIDKQFDQASRLSETAKPGAMPPGAQGGSAAPSSS
jgi:Family of unknown function (DUF6082)